MNFDKLKQSIGTRFRLIPKVERRSEGGLQEPIDDEWLLESVDREQGIRLVNLRTRHVANLNSDHVHHFTSAIRSPDNIKRAHLELSVKLSIKGDALELEPIPSGPARLLTASNAVKRSEEHLEGYQMTKIPPDPIKLRFK